MDKKVVNRAAPVPWLAEIVLLADLSGAFQKALAGAPVIGIQDLELGFARHVSVPVKGEAIAAMKTGIASPGCRRPRSAGC
jgi:hypothetical protein